MTEAVVPGQPILEIDDVYAGYGGGDVLRGVTFSVPQGGVTCVVGPNGAGKSTLLAAISGMLAIRTGAIRLRGQSIVGKSPRQILRQGVVQVPQNHSLFPEMTVQENVEMGGFIIRDRGVVQRRLEQLQGSFPLIKERASAKAGSLSGGQQRLVEFARCLMLDPTLVILDEPSMGLDPMTRRTVFESVRLMHEQGRTILLVEQNARAGLRLSTQGVVLETGRVRLSGTGQEVLNHPEIGALYLGGTQSQEPGATSV
ncbi:MAG TPA: ABC transporter ATP-binding protein [Candidatus Acidoferrales bacterium]|nr:ABC transporter ATP-binding protein [Candidatus Acidoferrales bacterium]